MRHHVRLLVCLACALLLCLLASDHLDATVTDSHPLRVVALGDSVMSSEHCDCPGILATYADNLRGRGVSDVVATNLGVSGYTTDDVLTQLEDPTNQEFVAGARVIAIIIGANDLLPARQQYESGGCGQTCYETQVTTMGRRLGRVLDRLQALRGSSPTTYLVLNYWNVFQDGRVAVRDVGSAELAWSVQVTALANQEIARQASAHHMTLVDLVPAMKGQDAVDDPTGLLADDGDHPNARGVSAIARAMSDATPLG